MASASFIERVSRLTHNRRRATRLQTRLRVDYCPLVTRVDGYKIGGSQRGVALDISPTGLFISDVGYLRLGSTLHLCLRLPDIPANPVVCYAKVVRGESGLRVGYGVRIIRIKETDRARLVRYITFLNQARARWNTDS